MTNMKKKQYSFLDHGRNTFDTDFEQFCKSTLELNVGFILHTDKLFNHAVGEKIWNGCVLFVYLFFFVTPVSTKEFHGNHLGKNSKHRECSNGLETI